VVAAWLYGAFWRFQSLNHLFEPGYSHPSVIALPLKLQQQTVVTNVPSCHTNDQTYLTNKNKKKHGMFYK